MNTRNPRRTNAAPAVQPADRAIPHPVIPELERVDADARHHHLARGALVEQQQLFDEARSLRAQRAALLALADDEAELFGRVQVLRPAGARDPTEREDRVAEGVQRRRDRVRHDLDDAHQRHEPNDGALRAHEGDRLRHHLTEHDVERRQHGERDDARDAVRREPRGQRPRRHPRLEHDRELVLAIHPEAEARDRDAELHRRDVPGARKWAIENGGDAARTGVTGLCWGGRITWLYAAHAPVKAAVAWYGRLVGAASELTPRHPIDLAAGMKTPVLGLYGANDAGIPLDTVDKMKARLASGGGAARESQFVVYPDAGHAFHADYRPTYRAGPAEDGWKRMLTWFKSHGVA